MKLLSALTLLLVVGVISAEKMRFDHHKVYKIDVRSEEQMEALRELEETPNGEYYFWDSPRVGRSVDVVVPPQKLYEFGGIMKHFSMDHELKIENFQTLIDAETPAIQPRAFGWTAYNNYTEIYDWMDVLLETYPTILTGHIVGTTYQDRPIRAVKLSYKEGNPTIFIESNIHAREWITSATATWFLNELLTSTDPDIQDLAQNIDWYIIPVFNVDGFHYTHTTNRLWRKTRQNHATVCFGTDGNRNFDFQWMVNNGASTNPCSETFAGPVPFSEPETVALRDFLEPLGSKINMYLSFHSQGQYVLFPYGHSYETTEYHDLLTEVGNAGAEGFAKYNNTIYRVGPTSSTLYIASGTSVDWAFNEFNIPLAYTFEFIGLGYGFVLPPEHILRNCYETRDAIIAMVARSRQLGFMSPRT
ncbi:Zinc carboxypeptidase A 1 [Pseudolycoriella hygida]|uniref:Zinc carboxypeptidase A 1 n=1 Tax=Pseudolycoriella hygida TaxID=35572 RepID=A0A9Q0RU85_9DIPT|nr:Zinc carboxypeptidase A 1 [Pseudolycoriella hygida]